MSKASFHILRVGLAVTFLWIGVLIFKQPEAWMGYLQPWVVKLLPISIEQVMLGTAVLDIGMSALGNRVGGKRHYRYNRAGYWNSGGCCRFNDRNLAGKFY